MTDAADHLRAALADRYMIDRELGRGGAAVVYLARDLRHDRLVALKVVRSELSLALGSERFLREIRVTAGLRHPHILPLFDSGEADGILWYTAPYVEGESLRARLEREGMLPVAEAVRIAGEVADALEYAHSAGVVHRDIKPGNILMLGRHAVVADFGISHLAGTLAGEKLTETGLSIGTPGYMSPEQATGGAADQRTDIYALGVVLYEMIAGDPPFGGPNSRAIIARQLTGDAPPLAAARPNLPAGLGGVVARALAREPADRYQTAGELGAALAPKSGTAAPAAADRPARRKWIGFAAAVGAAALVATLWLFRDRASPAPADAAATEPNVVAVLPFASSGADTALERLGRDLVFTLSAALDGVGDLRTADAHAILIQTSSGGGLHTIEEAMDVARRLGAGRLLTGSLVRVGADVRIDGEVYQVGERGRVRASFTASPDSLAALTDSLSQRVLPALLRGGAIPEASLESALRTRSVPALRAFLEGEQLLASSEWDSAIAAYGRAWQADTTFWLAVSRMAFALDWVLKPVPEALLRGLQRNAPSLPPRERLEFAAKFASADSGVTRSAERFRELVTRYPTSWFGWFAYGDLLMHAGPIVGRPLDAARPLFARTLELNPALAPAWDHDLALAAAAGDVARLRQGLAALERLNARPRDAYADVVLSARLLLSLIERDSVALGSALDSVVADKVAAGRAASSFYEPLMFGFPEAEVVLARAVLARETDAAVEAAYRKAEAYGLAAGGKWDSAVATMPDAAEAYGLAVLAAAADERSWDSATVRPGAGPASADRLFLDGVVAFGRRDRDGLDRAARQLSRLREPAAGHAARALGFYGLALGGDSKRAGTGLAELEWRLAEEKYSAVIDIRFMPALDRWFAARWLATAGDTAQAERLLLVSESRFLPIPAMESFVVLNAVKNRRARAAVAP